MAYCWYAQLTVASGPHSETIGQACGNSAKCLCYFMKLRSLKYSCLVGSVALIGADRIDVLGGRGSFRLPPFLVLAGLGVFLRLVIIAVERRLFIATTPSIRRQ